MLFDNCVEYFERNCFSNPDKIALIFHPEKDKTVFTFKDIHNKIVKIKKQLEKSGIKKYSRVLLFAKPNPDFYFFTLTLMAIGATPVFIEAKKEKLVSRILTTQFDAILIDQKLKFFKYLIPPIWLKKTFMFNNSGFGINNIITTKAEQSKLSSIGLAKMKKEDPLLISFTTGSTGKPKAADRNYKISYYQYETSMKYWKHNDQDVDLTFFPNIILQNLCSGVTTLVPDMTKIDISELDFQVFSSVIQRYFVTRISLPPGYLNQLCNQIKPPILSIKQLITGGAAVDKHLAKRAIKLFPNAYANIVYGSTEAEPISFINLKELAKEGSHALNVGKPIDEIKMQFLDPVKNTTNTKAGEILIAGEHVVTRYLNNNIDNTIFKHKDQDGTIWHKTGDIGYFNSEGELCIRGRKKHHLKGKTKEFYSLELETELSQSLSKYCRTAITQETNGTLHIYLESDYTDLISKEVENFIEKEFDIYKVKFIKKMPVDNRHHWKIDYQRLV